MAESKAFEFEKWCKELDTDTVELMTAKGFKSYRSCCLLSDEILKKDFKTLVPGQYALLSEEVMILRPDACNSTQASMQAPGSQWRWQH